MSARELIGRLEDVEFGLFVLDEKGHIAPGSTPACATMFGREPEGCALAALGSLSGDTLSIGERVFDLKPLGSTEDGQIWSVIDVTERVEAQKRAEEAESILRNIETAFHEARPAFDPGSEVSAESDPDSSSSHGSEPEAETAAASSEPMEAVDADLASIENDDREEPASLDTRPDGLSQQEAEWFEDEPLVHADETEKEAAPSELGQVEGQLAQEAADERGWAPVDDDLLEDSLPLGPSEEWSSDLAGTGPSTYQLQERPRSALPVAEEATSVGLSSGISPATLSEPRWSDVVEPLRELAESTGRKLGIKTEVEFEGEDAQLDWERAKAISDALPALVENAVIHGADGAQEAKLTICFDGGPDQVSVTVQDRGRGLDLETLSNRVVERQILTVSQLQTLKHNERMALAFVDGMGTEPTQSRGAAGSLAGVRRALRAYQGELTVRSAAGSGTAVSIKVPNRRPESM